MGQLSDSERQMLEFEREWWKYPGAKEDEIRRLFDISPTRYYQRLHALIDKPAALAYDAVLVKRLQRLRDHGRRRRLVG